MTAPTSATTRTTPSGCLEWTFAGERIDPHAKAIERIRVIARSGLTNNEPVEAAP